MFFLLCLGVRASGNLFLKLRNRSSVCRRKVERSCVHRRHAKRNFRTLDMLKRRSSRFLFYLVKTLVKPLIFVPLGTLPIIVLLRLLNQ